MPTRTRAAGTRLWNALTSLKLTITCLSLLMVLVVACTLAQIRLGTLGAVNAYVRSFLVWWHVPDTAWSIPVAPGGGLVGLVLLVNLIAAQIKRLEWSTRKAGLWVVHAGLILLFVGEFVTSGYQVEMQMAIEEGQTKSFLESPREMELALIDTGDGAHDEVYSIPESRLVPGASLQLPGAPVVVQIKQFFQNANLTPRGDAGPGLATAGIGLSVAASELPQVNGDDLQDVRAVWIEPVASGHSYGTWLVSNGLGAPQSFISEGHTWKLALRPRRQYLPYSLTLKKFSHDIYPGTDIPKNFSSLVHLVNPAKGDERDVLIYMNQPLRYDNKAFYQASFGKNDTLSILQVVANPGWLLPYISCVLVAAGLILHFALSLRRSMKHRPAQPAAAAPAAAGLAIGGTK